jgi:quercetin dioxygenase-like cupin family protein
MNTSLLPFRSLPWTSPATGVREKRIERNGQVLRLVEFSHGFIEKDWCTKRHIGYVVEGAFTLDMNGAAIRFEKGDGIWIEEGEAQRHKPVLGAGERVVLVLFE